MKQNLLHQLTNYHPSSIEEQKARKQMIAFINQYDNCFERSLEIGHFTASAWLLNKDHSKALLMHHAKLNMWVQLGGHCDGNSHVLEVAIKEAQEESGIQNITPIHESIFDIDVHFIPEGKEPAHYHYDVRFLLQVTSNESVIQNHESKELRWISKNKAELPTDSLSVVRMFDKWTQL